MNASHFFLICLASIFLLVTARAGSDSRVLMDEMTAAEVRDAIQSGKTTVLIFNASTESSGPHLVLGKHIFRARYLGERIARELGNALVAPVMPFAPTGEEMKFPGTINLSPETFSRVNEEVADSMAHAGFKYIILMGDHGGNQTPLKDLAPKLDERYRSQGIRVFFSSDAYAKSDQEIEKYLAEHGFPPSRHGGVADTSELWAAGAQYVRRDKVAMGDPLERPYPSGLSLGPIGVEGDPRKSSLELGKLFMDWKVKNGVNEIRKLINSASAGSGSSTLSLREGVTKMAHPVVHFEIGCRDSKKTQDFYARLFDWKINEQGPAAMIDAGSGITGHITALGHEPHNYTIFYVQVDDVQASLDKAKSLGGKMVVPPVEIPTGTFAWISDPEGNTVGLWKPKQ